MKRILAFLILLCSAVAALANDGVFYARGNQLIPITETDIRVKKEILTLERVGMQMNVTVHYEFFNPARAKDLLVGFEAGAPYPYYEEDAASFPEHPHMRGFSVMMNGAPLRWKVAQVEGGYYDDEGNYVLPPYYSGGKVQGWTRQQCDKALEEAYYAEYPFEFVYYFTAHFNEGLNIVEHTYTYDLSMSVEEEFSFYYILTAACRWAGGQIDDFTLRINMGQPDSFFILPTFYDDILEWKIEGAGKTSPYEPPYRYEGEDEKPISMVHLREGWISFHKKNFCPEGELSVSKPLSGMPWIEELRGDSMFEIIREQYPDWSLWAFEDKESFLTPEEKRILKNLPFACHGYVFKTPALQRFFESTAWYIPDPSYRADMKLLSKEEQEWVNYWSK